MTRNIFSTIGATCYFIYEEINNIIRNKSFVEATFIIFVLVDFYAIQGYYLKRRMHRYLLLICISLILSCSESPRFELLDAESTGIDFTNTIVESDSFHILAMEYIYNGGGVGIGDLNNDGLQDIVFSGNKVTSQVYRNIGDMQFENVTDSFNGNSNSQWVSGVVMVDINSDGWLDVYLTCTADEDPGKRKNQLWVSRGSTDGKFPSFVESAAEFGIDDNGYSVHAGFLDYDLDGDLDLYVMNNIVNERISTNYRFKIVDGSAINNDKLYRNNGNGTFTDVSIEAGIVIEGYGLGLAVGDVNKDGYPDIYVSNDYISNDLLYINQGNGTFKNEISTYMSYQTKSSMGNDMADINNDGLPDMYTMDMLPEYYYKKKQTINGFSYAFYYNDAKYGYEHQYLRNMLHLHNGFIKEEMIPYSEVGQIMGIYSTEWSWSPLFADYDNDGDKDLIISNGYPKDLTDKDWTNYKAQTLGFVASERHVMNRAPAIKASNFAFENTNDFHFTDQTVAWGMNRPSYSYGAAFVDLDNDGDLDYVSNNLNDPPFVYRNNTVDNQDQAVNYINIRLKGKEGNTTAYGAKVEIWHDNNYQYQEHFLSRGYISSVDPTIHFGLGDDALIDSMKVTWPSSGKYTLLEALLPNQLIEINEMNEAVQPSKIRYNPTSYLFQKKDSVLNYMHEQTDFADFFMKQPIIPHKFSQIGPRMAQGDMNGDGKDDVVVGSTNLLPTMVYINNDSMFLPTTFEGLTTQKSFSESDFAIVDIDLDGDNDVIALAGGYENQNESEFKHYLYLNNEGTYSQEEIPIPAFPASIVRPFDYDQDGDMDLFIGARIKKGIFPFAGHSYLVVNEGGSLKDSYNFDLGMVTDAIWSDYNGDGWTDLLVTREWNTIAVLENDKGQEMISKSIPEFDSHHGSWFSIAGGDFDNDGDQDYIAGNLGDNHRFHVSDQYPLRLYMLDLDQNGTIDPLSTGYWRNQEDQMTEYPINYLDELGAQTRMIREKYLTYASFSYATADDVLNEITPEERQYHLRINTTSNFILWNEGENFRWEKLADPLQVSPVKKMIIHDFNGDSYPDVLLGGNDHTYDVSTGYYDANKGFVLLSEGSSQSFRILPPTQSGILLQGMVESLLFFDGNPAWVVAGMNRSGVIVYKLNSENK